MRQQKTKNPAGKTSANGKLVKAVDAKTSAKRGKKLETSTPPEAPRATPATPAATPEPAAKQPGSAKERTKSDKLSALDAAAKVLAESGQPMTCKEMIEAMAAKGYWTSPAGRTPEATLYSSILRELKTKGNESRFTKTARGKFARA